MDYILIALIATAIFLWLYGARVLNPFYTDWLMNGQDLTQHYLGWAAYRNGSWQFPRIGLTDQLMYPDHSSVIFTDSIPAFAVFFKLFRNVLPENFQYFGWWGLMCFILQGVFALKLLRRYLPHDAAGDRIWTILMGTMFVLAPVEVFRMFVHTSLGGQWLILAALDICCAGEKESCRRLSIKWTVLGILCCFTHIYILFMCGILFAAACVRQLLRRKSLLAPALMMLSFLFFCFASIYVLGGFSSHMRSKDGGLGEYGLNLNSLFNPHGWSWILPDLPMGSGSMEEFAWPGLGFLVLMAVALAGILFCKNIRAMLCRHLSLLLCLTAACVVLTVTAISPKVYAGNTLLFEIPLSDGLRSLWSVFRSSGRLFWPVLYILMTGSAIIVRRMLPQNVRDAAGGKSVSASAFAGILAAVIFCVQIADIHVQLLQRHETYRQEVTYNSSLQDPIWEKLAADPEVQHVVLCTRFLGLNNWSLVQWALYHGYSLNDYYFGRTDEGVYEKYMREYYSKPDDTMVYIWAADKAETASDYALHFYQADNMIIGTMQPVEGCTEIVPGA